MPEYVHPIARVVRGSECCNLYISPVKESIYSMVEIDVSNGVRAMRVMLSRDAVSDLIKALQDYQSDPATSDWES